MAKATDKITIEMDDKYNLKRFVEAQEGVFDTVVNELNSGRKQSHWMWYIFPQSNQLGRSYASKYYGISGIDEADAYLQHPILGARLRQVCDIILRLPGANAREVFGNIDALKLRSSMTLFDLVEPSSIFADVLEKYFAGGRCHRTLRFAEQSEELD